MLIYVKELCFMNEEKEEKFLLQGFDKKGLEKEN